MNIIKLESKDGMSLPKQDENTGTNENTGTTEQNHYLLYKIIREIEKLEEQKSDITHAIKAAYEAAAGMAFNKKVLKQVIQDRCQIQEELDLFEDLRAQYHNIVRQAEQNQKRAEQDIN